MNRKADHSHFARVHGSTDDCRSVSSSNHCCGARFSVTLAGKPAAAQARRFNLSDIPKIVGVSDAQISPDGKSIAFVVSRANMETDDHDRQLV